MVKAQEPESRPFQVRVQVDRPWRSVLLSTSALALHCRDGGTDPDCSLPERSLPTQRPILALLVVRHLVMSESRAEKIRVTPAVSSGFQVSS